MIDYLKPLPKNALSNILHIGTNKLMDEASNQVVDEILTIKNIIKKSESDRNVVISSIIDRFVDKKAAIVEKKLNDSLSMLELYIIDNSNIGTIELSDGGLHSNEWGSGKLMNLGVIRNDLHPTPFPIFQGSAI